MYVNTNKMSSQTWFEPKTDRLYQRMIILKSIKHEISYHLWSASQSVVQTQNTTEKVEIIMTRVFMTTDMNPRVLWNELSENFSDSQTQMMFIDISLKQQDRPKVRLRHEIHSHCGYRCSVGLCVGNKSQFMSFICQRWKRFWFALQPQEVKDQWRWDTLRSKQRKLQSNTFTKKMDKWKREREREKQSRQRGYRNQIFEKFFEVWSCLSFQRSWLLHIEWDGFVIWCNISNRRAFQLPWIIPK